MVESTKDIPEAVGAVKNLTIKGGNIEGEHVKVAVDNLHVESLQDKSSSSNKNINIHGSSNYENNASTSAGITTGKYEKEWVTDQSSILGREDSQITVEGNTHLEGGLLGGKDTTLNTGSLSYNDINDYEKGTNVGINESISGSKKENAGTDTQHSVEGTYSATDREQITHATVGEGTIIVAGKEENPEGLNRDESKAQEIIKDVTVDEVNIKYDSERRDWTLKELDSIMSNDIKTVVVDPLVKLNEAFNFVTLKELTPYKVTIEKDENGNIITNTEKINGPLDPESKVHINGMQTSLNKAVKEITQQHIERDFEDNELINLEIGKKQEFILMHNDTNGFLADLYESAIDRYGTKGPNKIYSDAAKKLGDILWENKDKINEVTAFSQGTLLYAAAMKYIEDTHGEGSVAQIKTNTIILVGSAQPVEDFKEYMADRGNNAEINSKVDSKDLVGSLVGLNPGTVKTDSEIEKKKIKHS